MKHMYKAVCGTYVAALMVSAVAFSTHAQADVQSGVAKYEVGDYTGAIQEWLPLASDSDPNALFNLGQVYRLGRGVDKDMDTAKRYYERAARLGHVSAQGNLGTLYFFSEDPDVQDQEKAVSWWQEAAANGDARSQYMLGVLFFNGDVVSRDWTRAYAWVNLAASAGLPEAIEAETAMLKHLSAAQVAEARDVSPTLVTAKNAMPNSAPLKFAKKEEAPAPAEATPVSAPAPEAPLAPAQQVIDGPTPEPEAETAQTPETTVQYKLQLASFTSEETANQAWPVLSKEYADLLGNLDPEITPADLGELGRFYRLYASGFATKGEAGAVCDTLKASGQGCLVVSAR